MEIVTDRREFVKLCKRFGLDYEKNKVTNLSGNKVWACYCLTLDPTMEVIKQMEDAGYKLLFISGCFHPYIKRIQNENNF